MDRSVLIVDDSPILRAAIKKAVVLAGVDAGRITQAGNGQEALDAMDASPPDIVLLDLNMPVMDGETFARTLRESGKHAGVPIVVVSTETNKERLAHMRELGAVGILNKPFEPEEFLRIFATETQGARHA
jgi:two-component system, chemotaxis family, chemotaxis protein CheY